MKKKKDLKTRLIRTGMISGILSLLIMIFMYYYWNDAPTFGYGGGLVKWMSTIKELQTEHETGEDLMLVNVSYDRTVVPYYTENEEYLGEMDMTDRKKLNDFLNMLKERDAYRYIVCDINFSDPQLKSEYDEELFSTIASMRDIVVASSNLDTDPEQIRDKVALSKYRIRSVGDGFLKYDFMTDGNPSLALKMWQDIEGGTYQEFWWGARMNGKQCFQTVIPDFKFAVYDDVNAEDSSMIIQNMGKTLQYYEKYPSYVNGYDDKIVLLGAWYNDDIHDTIIGQQPGVVILYNAFLALCNRDNHVPFWISLIVFIVIWLEIMFIFREAYLPAFRQKHKGNEWIWRWKTKQKEFRKEYPYIWQAIDILAELISFATPLAILMIIVYLCTGLFVNIIIVGFLLGCINFCRKRLILYCK